MTLSREATLAYLAGLLDGEGSVSASPSYHSPDNVRVCIAIAMCDKAPIERFAETFGGRLRVLSKPTKTGKPVYYCAYYCRRAAVVLEELLPYLTVKASRAEDAIALARMMKTKGSRRVLEPEELELRHALRKRIRDANINANGRLAMYAA